MWRRRLPHLLLRHGEQTLIEPCTLYPDLRHLFVDDPQIFGCEFNVDGLQVVIDVLDLVHAGDGHDPGFLSQQPGQGDLYGRGVLPLCDAAEHLHDRHIGFHGLRPKAREIYSEVATAVELRVRVDRACKEASAEWSPRHEADAEFFAYRQYLSFRLSCPNGVLVLNGRHRMNSMSFSDGVHACL